jgi:hypothetical protein
VATLSDLRTYVARDLRDTSNQTWSTAELDDLINMGIDELASFYPKEIVSNFATVSAGVVSYAASSYTNIYRIDQYSGTSYMGTLAHGIGDGPDSGWELHAGVLWLPPTFTIPTGYLLRGFGYGGYVQLSASTQTTDLDTSGVWAVRVFAQVEGFSHLLADRAKFKQWQIDPQNTDVSLLQMSQLYQGALGRWAREVRRLRKVRKLG